MNVVGKIINAAPAKMRMSFILTLSLLSSVAYSQNDLSSFFQKNELKCPDLTIISIAGNECVNCYASIHYLLNELNLNKENTIFIIKDVPKRELEYFMNEKFGISSFDYKIIIDDIFFDAVNSTSFTSSISVCQSEQIIFQTGFKNIDLVGLKKNLIKNFEITLIDSIDISSFSGSAASVIRAKNDSVVLIYNYLRSTIFEFNISTKKVTKTIGGKDLVSELNNYIAISELDSTDINFSNQNADAQQMFNTVPYRIAPRGVYVTEHFIYIPIEVLSYDLVITGSDTSYGLKWFSFLGKYDQHWNLLNRYAFPYQVPGYKRFFNFLHDCEFLNDSTLITRVSTKSADSLCVKYNLPAYGYAPQLLEFMPVNYPGYFPLITKGMRNVYSSNTDSKFYYFNIEPVVYEIGNKASHILSGWEYQTLSDSTKTNVWIDEFHQMDTGNYFVIGTKGYNTTWFSIYDKEFNLIDNKKLMDHPLITAIYKNKLFGMDLTDEYGTLYIYEFQN